MVGATGYLIGMRVERCNNRQKRYNARVVRAEQSVHEFETAMCNADENMLQMFNRGTIGQSGSISLTQSHIDALCDALASIDDAREDCLPGTAV